MLAEIAEARDLLGPHADHVDAGREQREELTHSLRLHVARLRRQAPVVAVTDPPPLLLLLNAVAVAAAAAAAAAAALLSTIASAATAASAAAVAARQFGVL